MMHNAGVWAPCTMAEMRPLERAQMRAWRAIFMLENRKGATHHVDVVVELQAKSLTMAVKVRLARL
eukprot:1939148-Lingulodinium_polyedra.AAC.1